MLNSCAIQQCASLLCRKIFSEDSKVSYPLFPPHFSPNHGRRDTNVRDTPVHPSKMEVAQCVLFIVIIIVPWDRAQRGAVHCTVQFGPASCAVVHHPTSLLDTN